MRTFREQNRLIGAVVFLITCFVYIRTVAPTVTFWDTGEFIAASYILGVPHPPGAPFHTLLGRIFTLFATPDGVAFSVNLISVLSGAATALLLFLCSVRLLSRWLRPDRVSDRIAILTGGAVAALSAAFSTSFWANATEAEVYALSMLFTVLAFYLALRWDGAPEDRYRDRLLIFIVYLFFLGAGVHLQCLLTVPGILILVFSDLLKDRSTSVQATVVIGLTVFPFLCIVSPHISITVVLVVAVLAALLLLRPAWRHPAFWLCALGMIALGYSTYAMLFIRSGLDPFIDMNNPETYENFKAFLTRQQYGVHSIFPRRGDFWDFQLNIHIKYFLQQFPFYDQGLVGRFFSETLPAFTERISAGEMLSGTFRRAVASLEGNRETIAYSVVPILLGIVGAVSHFRRDWKRFASVFSMTLLMGFGLVLYLNMPDPEPREREYIFVGAYAFFGLWIGGGAAALIVAVARGLAAVPAAALAAVVCLVVPIGLLQNNRFERDRSGDFIAHDYARNILSSCEPNAIIFTNGDNDTYPLWYLQYVEGFRRDVRVVNLSLLKTPWYVKQLRDLVPTLPITMADASIDQQVVARPWPNRYDIPLADSTIIVESDDIPLTEFPVGNRRVNVLESHTFMIWYLVDRNNWQRPIYFAVTVPERNMGGLRSHLSMEGMVYRLVRQRAPGQFDAGLTSRHLLENYRYTGIADATVYKDPVARRLISNYLVIFEGLVRTLHLRERPSEALQIIRVAESTIPPEAVGREVWYSLMHESYRKLAVSFLRAGKRDSASHCLEELIRISPHEEEKEKLREHLQFIVPALKDSPKHEAEADPRER
ncbi:MAG: DUF2723 domain-containing protein [Gemmatimonadota bacterium]|nr:DUF2723 domain-containing protein [Gemmatimonadota bacterium]